MHRLRSWKAATPLLALLAAFPVETTGQTVPRYTLSRERLIGAVDGPQAITKISDIGLGRDGQIYVVEPGDQRLRVFGADGTVVRSVGRRGRGPGEFQAPQDIGWIGDTIFVTDPYQYRVAAFAQEGRHLYTNSFASLSTFLPRARLTGGRTLGAHMLLSKEIVEGRQKTTDLLTVAADGGRLTPFATLPLRNHTAHVRQGSGPDATDSYFPQPFADADLYDVDPFGRWVVTVSRPSTTGGRGEFVLTKRSPQGAVVWTARQRFRPTPLPAQVFSDTVNRYTEMFAQAFPQAPRARLATAVRNAVFRPSSYPSVLAIVAGSDGTTWIRRGTPGTTATWMIFNPAGRHVGYVSAPAELTVHAVSADRALGVIMNEDDIPFVATYRLTPTRR